MWFRIVLSSDMIGYPSPTHPMETPKLDLIVDQQSPQITFLHQIMPEFISDPMRFKLQLDSKSNTPVSKTTFQTAKTKNQRKNARSWKRRASVRKKELQRSVRRLVASVRKFFTASVIFPFSKFFKFPKLNPGNLLKNWGKQITSPCLENKFG